MNLILIVDADRTAADSLAGRICDLGYFARAVYNTESAAAFVASDLYDVVFVDLNLPPIDLFSVVAHQPRGGEMVLAGLSEPENETYDLRAYDHKLDFFFTKPVDPKPLRQFLEIMTIALA